MRSLRRLIVVCTALTGLVFVMVAGPTALAGATSNSSNLYPIDYKVNASTTLAKLNQTVKVPRGRSKAH